MADVFWETRTVRWKLEYAYVHSSRSRIFFAQQPNSGLGRLVEVSRSDTDSGRSPLDEGSACLRGLYLTTHSQDRHPCPPAEFEPAIPANERPQTHALKRAATGIGFSNISEYLFAEFCEGSRVGLSAWHDTEWDVSWPCPATCNNSCKSKNVVCFDVRADAPF